MYKTAAVKAIHDHITSAPSYENAHKHPRAAKLHEPSPDRYSCNIEAFMQNAFPRPLNIS
jgi:hypothetical protein